MSAYEVALQIAQSPFYLKSNLIRPKGLSFGYIRYRVLRPVLKLNYRFWKSFHPVSPWTTIASIDIFNKILNREMVGFEYGSGFSTLFLAPRLKHLTSVEHDPVWYKLVTEKLHAAGATNVDYQHWPKQEPDEALEKEFTFYQDFSLTKNDFQIRTEYRNYFSAIQKYPNEHFDFIMVDGRARVECCLLAIPRLKKGGIFVLDNSDRTRYRPVFTILQEWKSITTTTGLFDTTIWFKP